MLNVTANSLHSGVPRWWTITMGTICAAAVAICAAIVWFLVSGSAFAYLFFAGWALFFVGVLWLVMVAVGSWRYRDPTWRLSLIAPIAAAFTLAFGATGLPAKIGWAISENSLNHTAATCAQASEQRVGVYTVRSVVKHEGGCLIYTDSGWINPVGFAYFPNGAPRDDSDIGYEHIDGDWYRFEQQF